VLKFPGVQKEFTEELFTDAIIYNEPKINKMITVYGLSDYLSWIKYSTLAPRDLSTIYLDETIKNAVINDLDIFFSSYNFYHQNGIPYKRIYMLEGLPGTGKTSFVHALASN